MGHAMGAKESQISGEERSDRLLRRGGFGDGPWGVSGNAQRAEGEERRFRPAAAEATSWGVLGPVWQKMLER